MEALKVKKKMIMVACSFGRRPGSRFWYTTLVEDLGQGRLDLDAATEVTMLRPNEHSHHGLPTPATARARSRTR